MPNDDGKMRPRQRNIQVGRAVVQAVGPTLRNLIGNQRRVFFALFGCCGGAGSSAAFRRGASTPTR